MSFEVLFKSQDKQISLGRITVSEKKPEYVGKIICMNYF